jgi:hypothetical protein
LALPTDSNETFFQEVEENLRRDRMTDFFKSYGKWVAVAVVLCLAAIGGWIYWEEQQKQTSSDQSEKLHALLTDISTGKTQTVPQRVAELEKSHSDVIRASTSLTGAAVALEKNNRSAAIAKYRELVNDEDVAQPFRDVATVRLTALEFDTIKPEEVIARLQPLAKAGNPWFGSAGEMTALALMKQNKNAEAGRLFAAIAADQQVPSSIRSRAVQVAGTLGVDASASLPGLQQQD